MTNGASGPSDIERAVEVALMTGVVASGLLLFGGLLFGRAGLLQAGILLLMLTPVSRVVVVTVGLFHERDYVFGLVSLWILGVLGTSVLVAVHLW